MTGTVNYYTSERLAQQSEIVSSVMAADLIKRRIATGTIACIEYGITGLTKQISQHLCVRLLNKH